MPSSRGSSQPRDGTHVSRTAGRFCTIWATREALGLYSPSNETPRTPSVSSTRTRCRLTSLQGRALGSPSKLKKLTRTCDQTPGDDDGKEKQYLTFWKGKVFGIFLTKKGKQRVHFYQEALPPSQPPLKLIHPSIHSANIYWAPAMWEPLC